jgi:hypothetical protein
MRCHDEVTDLMGRFSAKDFFSNAISHLVDHVTNLITRRKRISSGSSTLSSLTSTWIPTPAVLNNYDFVDAHIIPWKEHQDMLCFTMNYIKCFNTFIGSINPSLVMVLCVVMAVMAF